MSKERSFDEFSKDAFKDLHLVNLLLPTDDGWIVLKGAPPDHPFIVNLKEWAKEEQSKKDCEIANGAVRKGL